MPFAWGSVSTWLSCACSVPAVSISPRSRLAPRRADGAGGQSSLAAGCGPGPVVPAQCRLRDEGEPARQHPVRFGGTHGALHPQRRAVGDAAECPPGTGQWRAIGDLSGGRAHPFVSARPLHADRRSDRQPCPSAGANAAHRLFDALPGKAWPLFRPPTLPCLAASAWGVAFHRRRGTSPASPPSWKPIFAPNSTPPRGQPPAPDPCPSTAPPHPALISS